MAPHSSGVKLEVWDEEQKTWAAFKEIHFQEAKTYSWRCLSEEPIIFLMQGVPIAMNRLNNWWEGSLNMPFQSGKVTFTLQIQDKSETEIISTYVYPDDRKLTIQQYEIMLQEILQEAAICLGFAGLELNVDFDEKKRETSWQQWDFIERSINQLQSIFRRIERQPLRILKQEERMIRREQQKHLNNRTIAWIERYGEAYGASPTSLPIYLKSIKTEETYNTYENSVMKTQLFDLMGLLKSYANSSYEVIKTKSRRYLDWLNYWLSHSFLTAVKRYKGTVKITQVFRKHPYYRQWYQWFQKLYEHSKIMVGFAKPVPLRNTYELYEIWAFMQLVKVFRELNILESTRGIYIIREDELFLSLAENHESTIKLKDGGTLSYQKIVQIDTKPYYSYTQRMIPDIVYETNEQLIVFDPKYRVEHNMGTALGEMHKYRDGILRKNDNERAVTAAYIITPQEAKTGKESSFFTKEYQEKYKMGAFCFQPGRDNKEFKEWIINNYDFIP